MTQLPALLLLHGVGDSGECLQPFVRALELPGLVSRTPNAPAHGGRRAAPGADVDFDDMVQEAQEHAGQIQLRAGAAGLVIGGHSMGAAVALGVAARAPAWPDDEFEPWARAKLAVDAAAFATPKAIRRPRSWRACGDGTVHRIPQTGHDVRRDNRSASTRLMRRFLSSLAA